MITDPSEVVPSVPTKRKRGGPFIDRTGQRFGKLIALHRIPSATPPVKFLCRCDCGNEKPIIASQLGSGITTDCGCEKRRSKSHVVHGQGHGSPTYMTWNSMKMRCINPNSRAWKDYGGRGIRVCQSWLNSFENFLADMGERPSHLSIDRKDNNAHYSCGRCEECRANQWPANCHYTDRLTQGSNQRHNVNLTVNGETHCVSEWARIKGIQKITIFKRVRAGWSHEDAVNKPVRA